MNELLKRLEERDAVIEDLTRRVDELEHRVAAPAVRSPNTVDGHTPGAAVPVAVRPVPKPSPPAAPKTAHAGRQGPMASADQATAAGERKLSDQPQSQQAEPAPRQFTVDEQAAERALERTLVSTGALLMPFGQAEVQPTFNYTRREQDFPIPSKSETPSPFRRRT